MENSNDIPPKNEPDRADPEPSYRHERIAMINDQLRARHIINPRVLDAMLAVPRHLFVAPELAARAYDDEALPSADGQTISQPYIVAFMSEQLNPQPTDIILELGTGTGYQTAILAHLAPRGRIFTIERSPLLSQTAHRRLDAMGITNIHYHIGDGSLGWPDEIENQNPAAAKFQFDRILVTAATPKVPPPLLDQLKTGGFLLAPLGPTESQTLILFEKTPNQIHETPLIPCRFVPLLGRYAFPDES